MLEAKVEKHFDDTVKRLGGETRKLVYPGRRGATDRLVLLPGWHCVVELKRPGGPPPRINQAREHAKLRAAGFAVYVLSTIEEVDAWAARVHVRLSIQFRAENF